MHASTSFAAIGAAALATSLLGGGPTGRTATVPLVRWGSCPSGSAAAQDPKLTCARLRVPLDHRDPAGRTIEITMSRRPADAPRERHGVLLLNPGGPGGSGLVGPS